MAHFIRGNRIAFDTETTGLRLWHGDMPFAFSFCNEELETAYFEFPVDPFTRKVIRTPDVVSSLEKIKALLEDPEVEKIGFNLKFDIRAAELGYGIHTQGKLTEVYNQAHVCNNMEPVFRLKYLSKRYKVMDDDDEKKLQKCVNRLRLRAKKLGWKIAYETRKRAKVADKVDPVPQADYWLGRRIFELHPELEHLYDEEFVRYAKTACEEYAVNDAIRTMMLNIMYEEKMPELGVDKIYNEIEEPLFDVVYRMESRGAAIRQDGLAQLKVEAMKVMDEILPRLRAKTWEDFWPKNSNHVRTFLFDILKLPITKMTKGGKWGNNKKPAADKDVLKEYREHPEVWDVVVFNANYSAYSTFYSKYESFYVPDGKCPPERGGAAVKSAVAPVLAIHCGFKQCGAATGRFSSADPNLQQVTEPKSSHSLYCVQVRPAFGPRPGYAWVCTDYDGMEVRAFAAISEEPTMLRAIREGRSIHDEMTNTIWGGENNPEAIKRAIMALGIDGSGTNNISELVSFWKEMKWDSRLVAKMSTKNREEYADWWLSTHDYKIVDAEASIGRKNSKGNIKMLTFLKLYGGGAAKAAVVLNCSVMEASKILQQYDSKFARVKEYSNELIAEAKSEGGIWTAWGRFIRIDPDFAYTAVNYKIQGTSADLMKSAMLKIDRWHRERCRDCHIILQVHDELITEVPLSELTTSYIKKKQKLMSDTEGRLPIEMIAESQVALTHWGDKRKVKL